MVALNSGAAYTPKQSVGASLHDFLADYLLHWVSSGLNGQRLPPPVSPERDERIRLLCLMLGEALEAGSVCIDLAQLQVECDLPKASDVIDELQGVGLLARAEQFDAPLVHSGTLLYLTRYFRYETDIAVRILELASAKPGPDQALAEQFRNLLQQYWHDPSSTTNNQDQKDAAAHALGHNFTIITGGPGTGKTTTMCKMVAAMLWFEPDLRIALAAPSGRAAARMADSMQSQRAKLKGLPNTNKEQLDALPSTGKTLHRLLGYQPTRDQFRYNSECRLPFDVVVVDEASMVDVHLFWALLQAMEPRAKLVLCGDQNQLDAVGPGSIFHELCEQKDKKPACSLLSNAVCKLTHNHRSNKTISQLADLVLKGSYSDFITYLGSGAPIININSKPDEAWLISLIRKHNVQLSKTAANIMDAKTSHDDGSKNKPIAKLLKQLGEFQILSPVRVGKFGSIRLNTIIEADLKRSLVDTGITPVSKIIITKNDYSLNLFNGDLGLLLTNNQGFVHAYFPGPDDKSVRRFSRSQLSQYELAFVLTVHKCQGSEFNEVVMLLPEPDKKVAHPANRQLLYTGITRAKNKLYLAASNAALCRAISNSTQRHSGFGTKLRCQGLVTELSCHCLEAHR